jgi:hypothetical protein
MELCETLAEAIRKLHGAKQQGAGPSNSMWQQPPLKWLIVLPDRILRIDQEAFIVTKNVGHHQADEDEQEILWTQPGAA